MIKSTFEESHDQEWIKKNITAPVHELVILRQVIPWSEIITRLASFYDPQKGCYGKSLRILVALLLVSRLRQLSDEQVVIQTKENRYIQYFCNVPDNGLQTFLDASTLCKFRKRIGEKGLAIIEEETFDLLRTSGSIQGETCLMDSSVLPNNIIYPNDVQLLFKAFGKLVSFAKKHNLCQWWDQCVVKKYWRAFGLSKKGERPTYLALFHALFIPALEVFIKKVESLDGSKQTKQVAKELANLLTLLHEQTLEKLAGKIHIKDRIVSLDEVDARPIKRGKSYPTCEFGATLQMSFNRQGFMITVENFIGAPNDKTLYPATLEHFKKRLKGYPDTVVTDLGFRSAKNIKLTPETVNQVFMGKSEDVIQEMQDFCRSDRSATEGFIAVDKNWRGFGCSLYRGINIEGSMAIAYGLCCARLYTISKNFFSSIKMKILKNTP